VRVQKKDQKLSTFAAIARDVPKFYFSPERNIILKKAIMGLFSRKAAPSLTEELTQRVWDVSSGLKQLEDRFDAQLEELSRRYRRAEQSEARFAAKKDAGECLDCEDSPDPSSLAGKALAARHARPTNNHRTEEALIHVPIRRDERD